MEKGGQLEGVGDLYAMSEAICASRGLRFSAFGLQWSMRDESKQILKKKLSATRARTIVNKDSGIFFGFLSNE